MDDEEYRKDRRKLDDLQEELRKEEKEFNELEEEEDYFRKQESKRLKEMYESTDEPKIRQIIEKHEDNIFESKKKRIELSEDVINNIKERYRTIENDINNLEEKRAYSKNKKEKKN